MNTKTFIALTTILLFSCGYLFQLKPNKQIAKTIETKYNLTKQPVDLTALNLGIKWDNFLILTPYSYPKDIAKKLPQFDLQNIYQSDIWYTDYHYELVFIKNNKSIATCDISNNVKISSNKQIIFN